MPLLPDVLARTSRRRRAAIVATLLVGTPLLGIALHQPRGSTSFEVLAAVLAVVWLGGGLAAGPVPLGRQPGTHGQRRPVVAPVLLGVLVFAAFALGALIVSGIPLLHDAVHDVIARADSGSRALVVGVTVVNGVAEEVFFRGAFYGACPPDRAVAWTSLCYVIVTAASGNAMLILAGALMGTVFALQRRATGGVLAPALTHITWSTLMIYLLPR